MELNRKQIEAINYINGNLQIVACAGSGKTEVITRRIVNMLKNGIKSDQIVAFTFTEKAAENMKERIVKRLSEESASYNIEEMFIGTIHAFCKKLLFEYTDSFDEFEVLDSVKEHLFINKYHSKCGCKTLGLELGLNGAKLYSECISKMVYEYERNIKWDEKVKTAFDEYKQIMYANKFITFSLLIFEVINRMRTDRALVERINKIKQLTVDEYQDTDDIQEKLIQLIATKGAYVCVVGDDDQTIYQFRGSNADNMIGFSKRYNNVKTIELDTNYRCDKKIIDIADTVITNNSNRLPKRMNANSNDMGVVNATVADDIKQEYDELAKAISKTKSLGIDYGSMAILVRKRSRLKQMADSLKQSGIPVKTEGTDDFLCSSTYLRFCLVFRFLHQQTDDNRKILVEEWGKIVDKKQLIAGVRFLQRLNSSRDSFETIFKEYIDIVDYNLRGTRGNNVEAFCKILSDVDAIYKNDSLTFKLDKLVKFLDTAVIEEYRYSNLIESEDEDAVQIMTIHKSKGLEFDAVYIPDLQEGFFPSRKVGGRKYYTVLGEAFKETKDRYETNTEDERKLFYVAVTRAKKKLFLFCDCSKKYVSPFLVEINESKYTHIDIPEKVKRSEKKDYMYEINIEELRNNAREELMGAFYGGGFGGALMEAMDIENASLERLLEICDI